MSKKYTILYKFLVTILCITIISSCSTEKNTPLTVAFHNMTAHYNVHFNGYQSYLKGMEKIEAAQDFDYTLILPVYLRVDENTVGSVMPDMDRTQKKAMKVIEMHSIKAKPEYKKSSLTQKQREYLQKNEYNKWVDDNYLLIGKSYFYQNNFNLALETFRFILREFEDEPITYETKVWMAKSYMGLENYKEAIALLNSLDTEKKADEEVKALFNAVFAQYYIIQEDYNNAITRLKRALKKPGGKTSKMRYTFILAQLYQKTGKNNQAYKMYDKVIKMNPPYEMTFNAKINMAGAFEKGYASSNDIKAQLEKMLKDDKNLDYRDQIYYAYGNIELKEGHVDKAIDNYILSANYSVGNDKQKAKSYLTLADLYYERPNYLKAQSYYDSATVLLPDDYPDFDVIEAKSNNLTELVKSIKTVELQDSVQHLATLSNKQRLDVIDNIIAGIEQQEREAQLEEQRRMQDMQLARMNNTTMGMGAQAGTWYFYNTTTKTLGIKEFKTRWGNRKLEDNWRRGNKKAVGDDFAQNEQGQENEKNKKDQLSNKTREYYLQDIPLTDSAMTASHDLIKESLVNIGLIYKNQFDETQLSVEAFEGLIKRYPKDDITLNAYYNLFIIYREIDPSKSEYYKNIIIRQYPDSKFAKVLKDPEYYKEIEKQEKEAPLYYEQTLGLFKQERYQQVIQNVDFALHEYKQPELVPKFKYLKTMSLGRTSDVATFRQALSDFIGDPSNGDLIASAEKVLLYLDNDNPDVKIEQETEIAKEIYSVNPQLEHFLIVAIPSAANIRQLVFNFQEYNLYNFDNLNLSVTSDNLKNGYTLVKIASFKNQMAIMQYHDIVKDSPEIFKEIDKKDAHVFFISSENYIVLTQDQNLERFLLFFHANFR